MDDNTRILAAAIEMQTKVLEGIAEIIAKASNPTFVTADLKIRGQIESDGGIKAPSEYDGQTVPIADFARLHGRLYEARELMDLFSAICEREGAHTSWKIVQHRVDQYRSLP